MGAGKGKSRRSQTNKSHLSSQTTATEALLSGQWTTCKYEKWQEFVKDSGLVKTQIAKYYLGEINRELAAFEYEKILAEMFADAVAVAALVLPDKYEINDLKFAVKQTTYDHQVLVTLKDGTEVNTLRFSFDLGKERMMYYQIHYLFNEVSNGLNQIENELISAKTSSKK